MTQKSEFLSLNSRDVFKGLVITVVSSVLALVYEVLQAGSFDFDYNKIALAGVTSGVAYLIKNLVTDQNDRIILEHKD